MIERMYSRLDRKRLKVFQQDDMLFVQTPQAVQHDPQSQPWLFQPHKNKPGETIVPYMNNPWQNTGVVYICISDDDCTVGEMGSNDKCDFCHTGEETVSICGTLHKDMHEGKVMAAHHKCMQYSAMLVQYKTDEFGGFKKTEVSTEIKRGKRLACFLCKMGKNKKKGDIKGATSGCALASCRKTFHYYCVSMNPKTVAKRYKVSAGNKEVILYRVFCSKSHEEQYRDNISAEDIVGQTQSSGDEDDGGDDKLEDSGSETDDNYDIPGVKRPHNDDGDDDDDVDDDDDDDLDDESAGLPRKKLRIRYGGDDTEQGTSNFSQMSSPDMTADEVVMETQRQYEHLLEKQKRKEKRSKNSGGAAGISIDTDSGENVNDDFNASDSPSGDDTDLSETESMLNSTQQGPLILIPSKLDVADLKTICQQAELRPESVLLWPSSYRGLKDKQMPYVMWDIAYRVRKGDPLSLVKMLSDYPTPDFETIRSFLSCGKTHPFDIIPELQKLVGDVNIKYSSEVLRLSKLSVAGMDLFLLILTLPNDLIQDVDLVTNFAVCQWTPNTVLTFSGDKMINNSVEKKILLKWMSHRLGQRYELFVFPKEDALKSQSTDSSIAHSVASRLKLTSQKHPFTDCPVKVLVIKNVDRSVTKYKPYVNKLLESFVYQHPGFECFCVIDILCDDEIREIKDVVPDTLMEYSTQVYSALCPTYNQVSCLVIHIDRDVRYEGQQMRHQNGQRGLYESPSKPTLYVDVDEQQMA